MAAPKILYLALLLLLAFISFSYVLAKPKADAVVWKEDVKYIKCEICEHLVKQLVREVKKKKEEILPKKVKELDIIEITEKICDTKKAAGEWLHFLDMVEEGTAIKIVEKEEMGECNSECKTMQRACEEVMGDHDTDVAELLYGGGERSALAKLLCRDLSKACVGKVPPVPKDRNRGEEFMPKPNKEVELDRLMKSMEGMPGAGNMKAYSRDDLLSGGYPGMEDMGDDDDDDEDEDSPKAKLKRAMDDARVKLKAKQSTESSDLKKPKTLAPDAPLLEKVKHHGQALASTLQAQVGKGVEVAKVKAREASKWLSSLMGNGGGKANTAKTSARAGAKTSDPKGTKGARPRTHADEL